MPKQKAKASTRPKAELRLLLLDTHIAIWLRQGNSRLSTAILSLLENSFHVRKPCLSPISNWEIGMLIAKQWLDLGQAPLVWPTGFVDKFNVNVLELSTEIAISSSFLPGKFHGDPADQILIATVLAHDADILSADANMVAYGKQGFASIIAV